MGKLLDVYFEYLNSGITVLPCSVYTAENDQREMI